MRFAADFADTLPAVPREKKKIDPRIWMGVCSGAGYVVVMGIKVYAFGWEGVPRFRIYAGAGVVAAMVAVAVFHRGRDRKTLKAAIERSGRRPIATVRPDSDARES